MNGKTVVITGATSGIGEVAADRLAAKGARIVFIARDPKRGEETLKHLNAIAPGQPHKAYYGDLSRLSEMKRVGAEIAAGEPQIDVLINNAGAAFMTRQVTEDGLEKTFALNHMSYFVLTALLRPRLRASGRIVSTASTAHRGTHLDFTDLQSEKRYSGFSVYGRSKLCNILFTRELARRLAGTGITANCLHPGFVATRFGNANGGLFAIALGLAKNFALSPEQGASTIIYLASSPEVETLSGLYFDKCKPVTPSREAQNDADAKTLWGVSEKISGVSV
ncbi:MAG TPA: SDR family oxidoreductase [Rhizomicrobium sp.]|nr:SDR family oxidoreductase [Rhizomicrobium sp.]